MAQQAGAEASAEGAAAEERVAVAANWRLVWWRFRRHWLAMGSAGLLIFLYIIVLVPDFFATQNPEQTDARQAFIPVQTVHFDGLSPWVPAAVGKRNPVTLRMEWVTDPNKKLPLRLFGRGYEYKALGLFKTNLHLIAPEDPTQRIFLLGSDRLGRDQWSRIMHGTQTSMTVGLVAVALSVILGVVLGGISGYVGGRTDQMIQRLIELEHLRFGRLCAGLHGRKPDAEVGYSILIFRLTDAEVRALLDGPPTYVP